MKAHTVPALVLWALAAVLILVWATVPPIIASKLRQGVHDVVVWQQTSPPEVYARFHRDTHKTDPAVYVKILFLNVTNLAAVRAGDKPLLKELGPYTFRKHRVKEDVLFNRNGIVTFKAWEYFLFQPHLSRGSLADNITSANFPLLGALAAIDANATPATAAWAQLLAKLVEGWDDPRVQGLFTTRTVGELLWGYEDQLLVRLAALVPGTPTTFGFLKNVTSPQQALLKQRTRVDTGWRNISQVGQIEAWENVTRITSWNADHVEHVRGTDGQQFKPGLTHHDSLEVWAPDLYRAVRLVANGTTRLDKVRLLRFMGDPQGAAIDPRYNQFVQGLMNITAPAAAGPTGEAGKPGPQIFMSLPHFCGADPAVAAGLDGLHCNLSAHMTFLDVEPITGLTMRAAKRLMMSTHISSRWPAVEPNIRSTFLPVFWVEESTQARKQQTRAFRDNVYRVEDLEGAVRHTSLILALVLAAAGVLVLLLPMPTSEEGVLPTTRRQYLEPGVAAAATQDSTSAAEQPLLSSHPVSEQGSLEDPSQLPEMLAARVPRAAD